MRTTSQPALAQCAAMPAPIKPEPITATLRIRPSSLAEVVGSCLGTAIVIQSTFSRTVAIP